MSCFLEFGYFRFIRIKGIMKILVINTGSSSIKYELFDMDHHVKLAAGLAEKISEDASVLKHEKVNKNGESVKKIEKQKIPDHRAGLNRIVELLTDPEFGAIQNKSGISAVGHRVVHGGEHFHSTTLIDESVMKAVRENVPLAPLHNPPNLIGIEVAHTVFPESPQYAVFDTAFHMSIPKRAYLYAIPMDMYVKDRVRRYGFHGTSHAYVAEKAAEHMNRPLSDLNMITIHLGNGASMSAIQKGKSIDTTMGMTPLEGLVMGTRSGDIDPAIPFYLSDHLNMSLKEINTLLNKKSGLKGLCGTNDMREVIQRIQTGDEQAKLALDVYTYRIKKYIGAFYAALGKLDCLVFTAGIGENNPLIRNLCCSDMNELGIELDNERNNNPAKGIKEVNSSNSRIKVLVVPTNEELKIADETKKCLLSQ